MNILQRLYAAITNKSGYENLPLVDPVDNPFTIWGDKKKIPNSRAIEAYNGLAYACIRAIAEEIANMEFIVKKLKKDGTVEELPDHEILDSLDGANDNQTGYDLKFKIGAHLELTGNAYVYMEGVKNELSKPTALYILNPAKVVPIISGGFPKKIAYYKYRSGTDERTFQPYEILHITYPDPNDDNEGVGTVQSIAQWLDLDRFSTETNRRYFLNGARLGGYLESEAALTTAQMDYLKKSFASIHEGTNNAYKTAILPKGVAYKEAGTTPKDMDFNTLWQNVGTRIMAGFRVPKSVLGITEDVNRANAEATHYIFALRTIKPKMQLIVSYLNEFLVPRYASDVYLDFKDPVPENTEMRIKEIQAATANQPIITLNEARQEYLGADPVEGGDEVYISTTMQPIGTPPGAAAAIAPLKARKKEAVKRIPKTRFRRNAERRKSLAADLAGAAIEAMKAVQKQAIEARKKIVTDVKSMNRADWEALLKSMESRVKPAEKKVTEDIRKLHEKQAATVRSNLQRAIKARTVRYKAVNKKALFDYDNEVRATIDLVTPELTKVYQSEGKEAAALVGVENLNLLTSEKLREALRRGIQNMAESYTQTTLDGLEKVLNDGIAEGATLGQLSDLVSQTYEGWNDWRAAAVAQTEVFRVANSASKDAWKETGVVKTIKWHTAEDELVCVYCAPLDGKVIDIEDNFFKKGETLTGSDGSVLNLDYANVGSPPLHPNCRCTAAPEDISIE